MKTIVLFFVLVAFAGVSAFPSRKHKAKESQNGFVDTPNNDWPQPPSLGQFGVPEGFGGGPNGGDQSEGGSSSGGPSGEGPSGAGPSGGPSGGGPSGGGPSGGGPSGEGPSGGGQGSGDNDVFEAENVSTVIDTLSQQSETPPGTSRVKSSRRRN